MPRFNPVERAKRLKGYSLFLQGNSYNDIARELGVTKSSVGRWATQDRWKDRVGKVEQNAKDLLEVMVGNEIKDAIEFFRGRIQNRIVELDALCRRGNLQAILAWLNRAGVPDKHAPAEEVKPSAIEIRNDLSKKPIEETH